MPPSGRVAGTLLLALSSCRQLLGIEDAELDPASDSSAAAGLGGARNAQAVGSASSSEAGGETTVAGATPGGADGAGGQPTAGDAGQGGSPR